MLGMGASCLNPSFRAGAVGVPARLVNANPFLPAFRPISSGAEAQGEPYPRGTGTLSPAPAG